MLCINRSLSCIKLKVILALFCIVTLLKFRVEFIAFKLPEIEKHNQSEVAGEDGNLTFYNTTILAISNDTENYYGLDNYNMIIYNSSVISYYSDFHTNFRKFYIYQQLFNPNKESIFLINSTFYSYASEYNGSIYRDSPFYGINSSVYYYEMPKFVFSNSIYSFCNSSDNV